jgi:flagellar basal-body rod modification protein FlgD
MATDTSAMVNFQQLTGYVPETSTKAAQNDLLSQDVFMNLLVTQLKNQDPLNPMENQEFVQQLASLSTVEQLKTANENLTSLGLYQSSINNAQSVSMIGKEVKAKGSSVWLDSSSNAKIYYKLDDNAAAVEISIFDARGNVVKTINQSGVAAGDHDVTWDGCDSNGSPLPSGSYKFEVTAKDSAGESVSVLTLLSGRVEGVSFGTGGPELLVNGQKIAIGDIYEVNK